MEVIHQVRLLLRRNIALRLRQPVILALELLWPVAIFLVVMTARNAIPPVAQPTCHYKAWALPSAGVVPFVQSMICNIDDCQNFSEYEDIPSYKGSSVRELVANTLPLIMDQNIIELVTSLPKGMRLMRVAVDALSGPDLSALLDDGFPIGNLLRDTNQTRELLQRINISDHEVEDILGSSIQLPQILELMSQNNFCEFRSDSDPYSSEIYYKLQERLCTLEDLPRKEFFRQLKSQLDIKNIVKTMGLAMSQLGRLDVSEILGNIGGLLISLQSSNILHEDILSMVTTLLEEVQFDQIDTNFILRLIDDLEPLYTDSEWSSLIYILKDLELPLMKGKLSDSSSNDRRFLSLENENTYPSEINIEYVKTDENPNRTNPQNKKIVSSLLQSLGEFIETTLEILKYVPHQTSSQVNRTLSYITLLVDLLDDVGTSLKNDNSSSFVNKLSDILGAFFLTIPSVSKMNHRHSTEFCNMKTFQEMINSSETHDINRLQQYACRISRLSKEVMNSYEKPEMETWSTTIDKLQEIFNEEKYSTISNNVLKWGTGQNQGDHAGESTISLLKYKPVNGSIEDFVTIMECGVQRFKELITHKEKVSSGNDHSSLGNSTSLATHVFSKERIIFLAVSRSKQIINYIKNNPLFSSFSRFYKDSDTVDILAEINKLMKIAGDEDFSDLPSSASEFLRLLPAVIFATRNYKLSAVAKLAELNGLPSLVSGYIQDLEPFIWESISPRIVQEFSMRNDSENFCVNASSLEATQLHWKWMLCDDTTSSFQISLPRKVIHKQEDSRLPVSIDLKSHEIFDARIFSRLFLQLSSQAGFILNVILQFIKPVHGCDTTCNDGIMLKKMCFLSRLQNVKNSLGSPKEKITFEESVSDDSYNFLKQLQTLFPMDEGIVESYDAFLDAARFSALSNHMDWKDVVRLLISALRFVNSMDGQEHKLRPMFHVLTSLTSLVKNRVSDAAQSAAMPVVEIQNVFPDSPLTQEVVKSFLPLLPDVISTFFWTSLAPGKLLDLVKHSGKNISVIMSGLCDSSLTEYLYNPALKQKEFEKLGEALCQHEYYDVFEEIFQDPDIQEIVFEASSTDEVSWEDMHNNILETVTLLKDLASEKRADISMLPPLQEWQNLANDIQIHAKDPSVILFVLNNKLFYGFCNRTARNLPKNLQNFFEENKEAVLYRELCSMSKPWFAKHLVVEVNKQLANGLQNDKNNYGRILNAIVRTFVGLPQVKEIFSVVLDLDLMENEESSESSEQATGYKANVRKNIMKSIERSFNMVDSITHGGLSSVILDSSVPEVMEELSAFIVNSDGVIDLDNVFENNRKINRLLQSLFQNKPKKQRLEKYIKTLMSYYTKPENSEKLKSLCKTRVERSRPNEVLEMMCSESPRKWSIYRLPKLQNNLTKIWTQIDEMLSEEVKNSTQEKDYKLRKNEIMGDIEEILMYGIRVAELSTARNMSFYFSMLRAIIRNLDIGKNSTLIGNVCLTNSTEMAVQDSVHNLLESIPGAEFLSCGLLNKNISGFYGWFSNSANLKENIQKIIYSSNNEESCIQSMKWLLKPVDDLEELSKRISRNISNTEIANINYCLKNLKRSPLLSSVEIHVNILQKAAKFISSLGAPSGQLEEFKKQLLQKISQHLPAFFRISDIVPDQTSVLLPDFKNADAIMMATLLETRINFNWLLQHGFSSDEFYKKVCRSYDFSSRNKVLSYPTSTTINARSKVEEYLCRNDSVKHLLDQMDQEEIKSMVRQFQEREFFSGSWLQQLIGNSEILMDVIGRLGSSLSEVRVQNLYDVLQLFSKAHVIQNVAESFEKLMSVLEPIFSGSTLMETLQQIVDGMKAFKSLSQLANFSLLYKPKDVFGTKLEEVLLDELLIKPEIVEEFLNTGIDLKLATMNATNGRVSFCQSDQDTSLQCLLSYNNKTEISSETLQDLVFQRFLLSFGTLGVEGVLREAEVDAQEAGRTLQVLSGAPNVVNKLTSHLETVTTVMHPEIKELFQQLGKGSDWLATPEALSVGGQILCGKPLTSLSRKFLLLAPDDTENKIEEKELLRLPTEFCRHGYKEIMKMRGGAILWGFLKPLFRGKILFSPKNYLPATTIIAKVNETFNALEEQVRFIKAAAEGSTGLHYLQRKNETLLSLQKFLSSKAVSKFLGSPSWGATLSWLESPNTSSRSLLNLVELVGNVTQCISLDRFLGFETESELEAAAATLHDRREFIAAIVFMGDEESSFMKERKYRNAENSLPNNIMYKIRMDIDNVPTTEYIKYRWWRPYPYDDFFEDLRYFRGFIQLQDTVDNAIIDIQTESSTGGKVQKYLQQFPYPCHQRDKFGTLLKGSMPAVMTISWVFIVAFLVRERVLGRELELDETLKVMGLKQISGGLAWFFTGFSILLVSVIGIVVVLKWGGITPNSDALVLFLFVADFAVLLIAYCQLMSTFFERASTAALLSVLLYVLSFFPFLLFVTWELDFLYWQKLLSCALVSTSFCFGCLYLNRYEDQGQGVHWSNMWHSPVAEDKMNFGTTLVAMALCSLGYFFVSWYVARVITGKKTRKPLSWYFLWRTKHVKNTPIQNRKDALEVQSKKALEAGDKQSNVNVKKPVGISISNVHALYSKRGSKEWRALSGLNLELYEDHITSLLGHNGAGKTTTIKILTGRLQPTEGSVTVYGLDIPGQLAEAKKLIGYCPQNNTLYDKLTVKEHLYLFSQLKGLLDTKNVKKDVESMLESLNLVEKQDECTETLSGGQRRRLCVGIAFVGGSKVVILDEPTSSVDPVARRNIWDLILSFKKGRTILFTTHHLDEADILSDRVAILHKGRMLCSDSPLQLKVRFGSGYRLSIFPGAEKSERDEHDSGRASSITETEDLVNVDSDGVMEFIQTYIPDATLLENDDSHLVVSLPAEPLATKPLSEFFAHLQKCLHLWGFQNCSLSSATLEEVFLTLCRLEDAKAAHNSDKYNNISPFRLKKPNDTAFVFKTDDTKKCSDVLSAVKIKDSIPCHNKFSYINLKYNQFKSLLKKRFWHTTRNWKALISSIVMPCLFIALAMGLAVGRPQKSPDPSIQLTPSLYSSKDHKAVSFFSWEEPAPSLGATLLSTLKTNLSQNEICTVESKNCQYSSLETLLMKAPPLQRCLCEKECPATISSPTSYFQASSQILFNMSKVNIPQYLLDSYLQFNEKRYGGWTINQNTLSEDVSKVWFENSGYHAAPSYLSTLNNAILKERKGHDFDIQTWSHPLRLSVEQLGRETLLQRLGEVGISFVFLIGLSLVPCTFAVYIVAERQSEQKRLQMVTGAIGPILYWSAALVWDLGIVLVTSVISAAIVGSFALPAFYQRQNFRAVYTLIFLYGWATTPLTYLCSGFFREGSLAFMVIFTSHLFVGLVIMLALVSLRMISISKDVASTLEILQRFSLAFPQYSLVGGLTDLNENQIRTEIFEQFGQDIYMSPFRWNSLGPNYVALFVQGIIFFLLTILLEILPWKHWYQRLLFGKRNSTEANVPKHEDPSKYLLQIQEISQVYHTKAGRRYAVDSLSLNIPEGECFGLVGANGAGKTTLFRLLIGEVQPTSGRILSAGLKSRASRKHRFLGYCPQKDALDGLLTPRQHLNVYAGLRGIPTFNITKVVEHSLQSLELDTHADRPVDTLSGGTKRKLCTAIATLGEPELVLLDEPTSGMDPATRRLVWKTISQITEAGRSVILTSHSIEDCDVLCSRLGIMVNGKIACLDSPTKLKSRLGTGYTLSFRISEKTNDWSFLLNFIHKELPSAHLQIHSGRRIEMTLLDDSITLSNLFCQLEDCAKQFGIEDLAIDPTTLDQVFVNFVRQQSDAIYTERESVKELPILSKDKDIEMCCTKL